MATINLGNIKFKWQGAYNGATAYTVDDVVSYNGSSYICIANSTGNLPTNTSYFEQMSSAGTNGTNGTNGTDFGTILTTQGDLVYRDGSGIQRLGAGTAGQVLQTGGSGANPSWGTVSSDFVKLAEVNATGTASSIDFTDVFTSDYHGYQLLGKDIHMSGGTQVIDCKFTTSGGTVVSTNYTFFHKKYYNDFVSSNGTSQNITNTYNRIFLDGVMGTDVTNTSSLELIIQPSIVSGKNSFISGKAFTVLNTGGNPYRHFVEAYGHSQDTSAMAGITLQGSAGNNVNGNFILYGMKS